MQCEALFNRIDELNDEFIQRWIDVGNIESPTKYKDGVDAVGKYFADYAKARNWEVEIFEQPISGNCVCITMNSEASSQPITLSGHIDTVHSVGSFGTPAVRTDEKYIYGPGVTDCKGGTVAALMAMTALQDIGFTSRPIRLILQSDEEVHSLQSNKATINYICEKAKDSVAFLNCESTRGNSAVLWRKGINTYRLDIKGKSIHASRCAEGGASAVLEAAHKIIELEKIKDVDGVTCNCGIISGGTAVNSVPDNCSIFVDIRFNTAEESKWAEKKVKSIAAHSYVDGTECEVVSTGGRCAMEKTERNFAMLERMNKIYEENGLPTLTARQSLGGSDAAEITQAGIPCVDSIGVAGDRIHSADEYGVLSSLREAAKRIASCARCY